MLRALTCMNSNDCSQQILMVVATQLLASSVSSVRLLPNSPKCWQLEFYLFWLVATWVSVWLDWGIFNYYNDLNLWMFRDVKRHWPWTFGKSCDICLEIVDIWYEVSGVLVERFVFDGVVMLTNNIVVDDVMQSFPNSGLGNHSNQKSSLLFAAFRLR